MQGNDEVEFKEELELEEDTKLETELSLDSVDPILQVLKELSLLEDDEDSELSLEELLSIYPGTNSTIASL
jgi:hypothetical protein